MQGRRVRLRTCSLTTWREGARPPGPLRRPPLRPSRGLAPSSAGPGTHRRSSRRRRIQQTIPVDVPLDVPLVENAAANTPGGSAGLISGGRNGPQLVPLMSSMKRLPTSGWAPRTSRCDTGTVNDGAAAESFRRRSRAACGRRCCARDPRSGRNRWARRRPCPGRRGGGLGCHRGRSTAWRSQRGQRPRLPAWSAPARDAARSDRVSDPGDKSRTSHGAGVDGAAR